VQRLVEYQLVGGGIVLVEVDEDNLGALADELVPAASPGELAAKAGQSFDQALASIKTVAKAIDAQVRSMTDPPDEASVEFGITLTGGVNAVIASAGTEATLAVTLTWKFE